MSSSFAHDDGLEQDVSVTSSSASARFSLFATGTWHQRWSLGRPLASDGEPLRRNPK